MPAVLRRPPVVDPDPDPGDEALAAALRRFIENNKDAPLYLKEPALVWLAGRS